MRPVFACTPAIPASSAVEYEAAFGGIGEVDASAELEGTLDGLGDVDWDWSVTFCEHAVSKAQIHVRAIAFAILPGILML